MISARQAVHGSASSEQELLGRICRVDESKTFEVSQEQGRFRDLATELDPGTQLVDTQSGRTLLSGSLTLTLAPEGEEDDYHIMGACGPGAGVGEEHQFWVSVSQRM